MFSLNDTCAIEGNLLHISKKFPKKISFQEKKCKGKQLHEYQVKFGFACKDTVAAS